MLVVLAVLLGQERRELLEEILYLILLHQAVVVAAVEVSLLGRWAVQAVVEQVVKVAKQAIAVLILQLRAMQVVLAVVVSVLVAVAVRPLSAQTQRPMQVGMAVLEKPQLFLEHQRFTLAVVAVAQILQPQERVVLAVAVTVEQQTTALGLMEQPIVAVVAVAEETVQVDKTVVLAVQA